MNPSSSDVGSAFPSLPLEIWFQIIQELRGNHPTLKVVCQVCKHFTLEAQRILFDTLHLDQNFLFSHPHADVRTFLGGLASPSSSIAHLIHTLKLESLPLDMRNWEELNRLCAAALCAMKNLRHLNLPLSILLTTSSRTTPILLELSWKAMFKLHSLETDIRDDVSGFVDFIRSQQSLRSISWRVLRHGPSRAATFARSNVVFMQQDLPLLRGLTLSCPVTLGRAFLRPPCSITHIRLMNLYCGCVEFEGVVPSLLALMIASRTRLSQLLALARSFPRLEYLELGRTDVPSPSVIAAFPSLVKLKMWVWADYEQQDTVNWESATQTLASTTYLLCVDAAYRTYTPVTAVTIIRARKSSTVLSAVLEKRIKGRSSEQYDGELERWNGVIEE